jgi:hypothetical protein
MLEDTLKMDIKETFCGDGGTWNWRRIVFHIKALPL